MIRGNTLVHNYALVLFQNPNLRDVGLPNLVEISRGGVRIVDNAELCYANTINWTEIIRDRYTPPFIDHNQSPSKEGEKKFFSITAFNFYSNIYLLTLPPGQVGVYYSLLD